MIEPHSQHPTVQKRVLGWTTSIQTLFSNWDLLEINLDKVPRDAGADKILTNSRSDKEPHAWIVERLGVSRGELARRDGMIGRFIS
jgi:hypothetical protein